MLHTKITHENLRIFVSVESVLLNEEHTNKIKVTYIKATISIMYVVSIDDHGEERNFLATHIAFSDSHFTATINGLLKTFGVSEVISVEPICQPIHTIQQTPSFAGLEGTLLSSGSVH
jgi:hypothetical protein